MSRRAVGAALVCFVLLAGCAGREATVPSGDASTRATALADEFLDAYLDRHPEMATYYGIEGRQHDRLTDNSMEALAAWQEREDGWLLEIRGLDGQVSPGDPAWPVFGILRETLEASAGMRICRTELWSVSQTDGWQTFLPFITEIQPVGGDDEREQALARARALGGYLDTEIANLREGLQRGYAVPKRNVQLVLAEIRGLLAPDSPLGSPARRDDDSSFKAAYGMVMEQDVRPALQRYISFLETEYLPAARTTIAVADLPDGEACYRATIRYHSTIEKSPREIHDIGLREMARIQEEMRVIAERSFDTSDVPALLRTLTTDPRYAFESREAIIEYQEAAVARAKEAMPNWFGIVPRAEFRIEPYPAYREASGTGEYASPSEDGSRPGIYYIPTREPQKRPRAGQESLAFHETIPGHHLQGAIALELGDRAHSLSRYLYNSGYSEGWGLYSERLADEMGLYGTDLDRIGMLSDQAGRAARLVIDTGIHSFSWTRDQSIEYMASHTTWSLPDVDAEIDRYIIWPGQATAYMLGMLEIQRLRERARGALGKSFRIQDFHDRVLEDGSVTLGMLEEKIDRWIASGGMKPAGP